MDRHAELMDEIDSLPLEQQMDALKYFEQEACKNDLFYLTTNVLGYTDVTRFTHGSIIETLESPSKRKLVCVPRGCFKSSLAVISYSISRILKDPNIRIMVDSELFSNSKNFLREIKAHLESQRLIELFGEFRGDIWNESEIVVRQKTSTKKEATIVCSGIGAQKTSQHFDLIIGDDLSSTKNTRTKELAQKTIEHYRLYTSLLEPEGTIVIIGTRYADNDLIGHILKNECPNLNPQKLKPS